MLPKQIMITREIVELCRKAPSKEGCFWLPNSSSLLNIMRRSHITWGLPFLQKSKRLSLKCPISSKWCSTPRLSNLNLHGSPCSGPANESVQSLLQPRLRRIVVVNKRRLAWVETMIQPRMGRQLWLTSNFWPYSDSGPIRLQVFWKRALQYRIQMFKIKRISKYEAYLCNWSVFCPTSSIENRSGSVRATFRLITIYRVRCTTRSVKTT